MGGGGCWSGGAWWRWDGLFWFGLFCFLGFSVGRVCGVEEGGIDFLEGVEAAVEVNSKA